MASTPQILKSRAARAMAGDVGWRKAVGRVGHWSALAGLVPGALTVYLSFDSGGFYPGATAAATVMLAALLLLRVLLAENPFEGIGVPLAVAAGAMILFAVWTLGSGAWSDSSARAMLEFDRVLLYLLALLYVGSFAHSSTIARWMLWGLAIGMSAVCTAALITRTLPDVWSAPADQQIQRLSYPIGYWNGLGLAAAIALVLCLHITSSSRQPPVARVAAAAVTPVLGSTLFFTFSRGPMAAAGIGLLLYMVLGRPRLLLTGLVACVPATGLALLVCYNADLLAEFVPGRGYRFSHDAVSQGHDVALVVALCVLGAALLRGLGLAFDPALAQLRLPQKLRRRIRIAVAAVVVVGSVMALAAALHGGWLGRQSDRFLQRDPALQTGDYRDRLLNPSLARSDGWDVALNAFRDAPVKGTGAGTYRLSWERHRPTDTDITDAHSLYLEVMGELGLVGILLIGIVLLTFVGALALRLRGRNRSLYAAFLAATLIWAGHAAVDWDWELPAVTLWLFAVGGLALSARPGTRALGRPGLATRLVLAGGIVLLAITPARILLSDARLADSVQAYEAGNCGAAVASARGSISALGNRPDPYEVTGYCEMRTRSGDRGVGAMQAAVKRDPRNWAFHYGLALTRAASGMDPRPEARLALRLNPRELTAQAAVRRFRTGNPAAWRQAAAGITKPKLVSR